MVEAPLDLSLLLDESLLADSVLRVSGREIAVHRAILAARWPRFYERFLDGSIDSVVDVGEIEPEVFEKLLKCVYSNRIPVSIFHDTACKDLALTLEQTRFLKHIQTNKQRQNSTDSSTNISTDHLDGHSLQLLTPENEKFVHESITHRSFTYSTVITKKEYNQSTTSLDSTLNTVFPGKHDNISVAIWKISLKKFDEKKRCNYCRLKLIALENASSVKARTRLCIYNIEGRRHVEINTFDHTICIQKKAIPSILKRCTRQVSVLSSTTFLMKMSWRSAWTLSFKLMTRPVSCTWSHPMTWTVYWSTVTSAMLFFTWATGSSLFIVRSWRQCHPSFEPCSHPTWRNQWPKKSRSRMWNRMWWKNSWDVFTPIKFRLNADVIWWSPSTDSVWSFCWIVVKTVSH